MSKPEKAVLLVNLGSPDSPETKDVRTYLREFLMDERVLDSPYLIRKFVLECFILPKRPAKSAEAYQSIWWDEGSPLVVISERVLDKLDEKINVPVALGMRYGNPSTAEGLAKIMAEHPTVREILLVPLYPHYAMSSYETAVAKAEEEAKEYPGLKLVVQPPFYKDEIYIEALAEHMRPYLEQDFDRLLFSYHGIPERHLRKSDPTKKHCLKVEDCCNVNSEAHQYCYRHQVFETTKAVAKKLNLKEDQYAVSFQSRLGRDPWLTPFTDKVIDAYPSEGVKKLLVVCPSFVSDCLETLEEIGMEAKSSFLEHGGEHFELIPCLNTNEAWIDVLKQWTSEFIGIEEQAVSS